MGKCIKCDCNFVSTAENPPTDGLCKYCEIQELKRQLKERGNGFTSGTNAMSRHCKTAIELIHRGEWTLEIMDTWLTAVIENDAKYLRNMLVNFDIPKPIDEGGEGKGTS